MILVDTSVWVDHLHRIDATLQEALNTGQVLVHPFVVGEIALGSLRQRGAVLTALQDLPQAVVASDGEVLGFIERHGMAGRGIGHVDAHLLASARLSATSLWTRDKRLHALAREIGVGT